MMPRRPARSRRRGLALIEILISAALIVLLMGKFLNVLQAGQDVEEGTRTDAAVVQRTLRGIARVTTLLRGSGAVTEGGLDYPLVMDDGVSLEHPELDVTPPHGGAGVSHGIVFRRIADADEDGWPDTIGTLPVWDPVVFALTLSGQPDGTNDLVLVDSAGNTQVVARGAESFSVETPAETSYAIPLGSLRVRMELASGEGGERRTLAIEEVLRPLNGGLVD